ncbi:MAG: 16S rRNA (cytosine(967)-C(5))-methyltransferase RsmB [Verrucomicrobiota bacterium]
MRIQKPREIAFRTLLERARSDEFVESLLEKRLSHAQLSPPDRGLIQELVFGIARWQATLDWLIARKTEGRSQNAQVQLLLRLGLYQMFWLDRVPQHAAVHETVELAKQLGLGHKAGFINAVLRNYTREFESTEKILEELKRQLPATGFSHPEWLVQRWRARWGDEATTQLLEWNNTPAKVFARVNTLKTSPEALAQIWSGEGVRFIPKRVAWAEPDIVFQLESPPALNSLASFQHGLFYVQDPSTLLAVAELDPQPGENILDMCAAPGGKTTYIAQRMKNQGRLSAQDLHPLRLKLVEENCLRLGVTCADFTRPSGIIFPELTLQFDRVLLDAPCSNTGVMRRRVDLRWRIRPEEIERLVATQLELLHEATMQLRAGGTLVYSTCSLEPEENEGVIKTFLQNHPDFELANERELLPFRDAVDGAYVAQLVRKAS